jgi:hypothetical protein
MCNPLTKVQFLVVSKHMQCHSETNKIFPYYLKGKKEIKKTKRERRKILCI